MEPSAQSTAHGGVCCVVCDTEREREKGEKRGYVVGWLGDVSILH